MIWRKIIPLLALLLATPTLAMASEGGVAPNPLAVIPFAVLLLSIAICPLVAGHFWHHHYPKVAVGLGLITGLYYAFVLHQPAALAHVGFEYFSFIALLASLFICSGGVVIRVNRHATPMVNVLILLFGCVLANFIGTTGAAMLLIRPFMNVNKGRLRPYHVVFFIFMVANVGGALTPIGDPPLFLGFLRGIDFFRFLELNWPAWIFAVIALSAIFMVVDSRNKTSSTVELEADGPMVSLSGWLNILFLGGVVGAVFLDPGKMPWIPAISEDKEHLWHLVGKHPLDSGDHYFSYVREIIQLGLAGVALWLTPKARLAANGFSFAPIKEVAYLFVGIFLTMIPALDIIKHQAASGTLFGIPLNVHTFYFGTGILSGVLDNAPTFVSFLAGVEGLEKLSVPDIGHSSEPRVILELTACALASVFWGAMTYIGNGPNFMVKSIADNTLDDEGKPVVECPSFFGYIIRYSIPFLLPVLILVWLLFLSGWVF